MDLDLIKLFFKLMLSNANCSALNAFSILGSGLLEAKKSNIREDDVKILKRAKINYKK